WPAWVAAYLFFSFDSWYSTRFVMTGKTAESLRATFGWSLLLLVIFTVLVNRYLVARKQGRLADGIGPPSACGGAADSEAAGAPDGDPESGPHGAGGDAGTGQVLRERPAERPVPPPSDHGGGTGAPSGITVGP